MMPQSDRPHTKHSAPNANNAAAWITGSCSGRAVCSRNATAATLAHPTATLTTSMMIALYLRWILAPFTILVFTYDHLHLIYASVFPYDIPPHPSLPFVFINFLWERNIDNFVHTLSFFTFIPLFVWRPYTMVKVSMRFGRIFTSLRYQFVYVYSFVYLYLHTLFTYSTICISFR